MRTMANDAPRRLVVVEANEIPMRVVEEHVRRQPRSTIADLVRDGQVAQTEVRETVPRLYPSCTWYSMNSGVPYEEHGVFYYGDPKPAGHPLYWQVAARSGKRVGVVNTLHSSPLSDQAADDGIVFAVPDCFASDAATLPARYERFQELNLELTRRSGRRAHVRPPARQLAALAGLPALGVRPATFGRLGALAGAVATKRASRERLRSAQALLLGDMFRSLCRRHDPDLAVMFTNHVASAMHRYWYALFPEDWDEPRYDDAWVRRYGDEIPAAMRVLDRMLAPLVDWALATDRTVVVLTSMGQSAETALDASARSVVVVRDPQRFVSALGVSDPFRIGSAMVPQIHVELEDTATAARVAARLSTVAIDGGLLTIDVADHVVTISYGLGEGASGTLTIDGRTVALDDAGAVRERVDDHRSGDHDPRGSMLVLNGRTRLPEVVDALDVAPMLLETIGVAAPDGMRSAELHL